MEVRKKEKGKSERRRGKEKEDREGVDRGKGQKKSKK